MLTGGRYIRSKITRKSISSDFRSYSAKIRRAIVDLTSVTSLVLDFIIELLFTNFLFLSSEKRLADIGDIDNSANILTMHGIQNLKKLSLLRKRYTEQY